MNTIAEIMNVIATFTKLMQQMFEPLLRIFLSTQDLSRRLDAIESVYTLYQLNASTRIKAATFHAVATQLYGINF